MSEENKLLVGMSPPASMIKDPNLNFETNTGHINTLKHRPESCYLELSNVPRNAKIDPEYPKI